MEDGEMTDTSREVMERYRAMLLARSGEERLKMGASMNATARALIRASVLAKDPQASSATLRRARPAEAPRRAQGAGEVRRPISA